MIAALTIIMDGLLDELLHFLVPGWEHMTRRIPVSALEPERAGEESNKEANDSSNIQTGPTTETDHADQL